MLFPNKIPITPFCQQWMEDELPPDEWYWHWPDAGYTPFRVSDDFYKRYRNFVCWAALESFWCQCVRQPRVSHLEYNFVVGYIKELERDCDFTVPARWSNLDFATSFDDDRYAFNWSHYHPTIIDAFQKSLFKINPTHPLDDPRHPEYNDWQWRRDSDAAYEEKHRVKEFVRVTDSAPPPTFVSDE